MNEVILFLFLSLSLMLLALEAPGMTIGSANEEANCVRFSDEDAEF